MMAKAVKSTTKKRKTSKKKAVNEEPMAAEETEEQNQPETEPESTSEPETEPEPVTATATVEDAEQTQEQLEEAEAELSEEESTHAKYERIKKGNLYLTDLQRLTVAELHDIAKKENITEYSALKKQDLIFRILKERLRQNGLMYGEGVLEVLPDGYGFLRNPDYNYLSSSDDIYVSPSQIRRFGLRTGNIVSGQIRPPKDSEKYFALLRVEAINYENPDYLSEKGTLHPRDHVGRAQYADYRFSHTRRQRSTWIDCGTAPNRKDDSVTENCKCTEHQSSGRQINRPADRRTSRRSDRNGAENRRRRGSHQFNL
jgi:transcription termination factor Rho